MLIGDGEGELMKGLTGRQVPEVGFRVEFSDEIMGSRKMISMTSVNMFEAKTNLSKYVAAIVEKTEPFIIISQNVML